MCPKLWDQQGSPKENPKAKENSQGIDQLVLEYTSGEDHLLDEELVEYDLKASEAHACMLCRKNYLQESQFKDLQKAIAQLMESHRKGEWKIYPDEEDCHTAIENRLTELAGETGKAIHLGRSRNDQVLAALRLWLKDQLDDLSRAAENVAKALEQIAGKQGKLQMPGYTHLQRAMPSTVALWALGFASEIRDDAEGLMAAKRRADKNPLGSAAGYGVPVLDLDRKMTAKLLDFARVHEPVTAVQISRGKAEAEALFQATMLAQDLGKLASDLCLFASAEFGFVKIDERFTTGSSIMPQKKNPDVFELVRGRTAEAGSALHEVLSITAKLPSGYHRDLQLLKKPLFRGIKSVRLTAEVMAQAMGGVEFVEVKMKAAMDPSLYATEEAYRMVAEEGVPFREAYRKVKGKLG